ncbi:MAG: hypothetical protein ACWA6U_01820 [Breznakibacter sp.]
MKKIILLLMLGHCVMAQQFKVVSVDQVLLPDGRKAYYPVFSNSGSSVLYSNENYKGLYHLDLKRVDETVLSESECAGYRALFAPDDRTVYYVTTSFKDKRKFSSLKSSTIQDGTEKVMVEPSRKAIQPVVVGNHLIYAHEQGVSKQKVSNLKSSVSSDLFLTIEDRKLVVHQNGMSKAINPANVESYIWPTVSPDGSKIAFYAIGKGAFVCNPDGSQLVNLGEVEAPRWVNNQFLVGMDSQDNGHYITASSIVVFDLKSKTRQVVTGSDLVAMHPSASVVCGSILFNTLDGKLFQMKFVLE